LENIQQDDRLTIKQSAARIGVSENTIRNYLMRGELHGERIGARIIRIRKSDLDALFTPFVGGEFGVWAK
jgi:excisionase family DNA binding protein